MSRFWSISNKITNAFSINIMRFKLPQHSRHLPREGQLVKVRAQKIIPIPAALNVLKEEIIHRNPNSLFIWTTPTTRLKADYEDCIYPGHNWSSGTNEDGKIICEMSKRPGKTCDGRELQGVIDPRFKKPRKTRLYFPRYSSTDEELDQWMKRAAAVPDYPLFIHIIPFDSMMHLTINSYKENVDDLQQIGEHYSLYSFIDPSGTRYIRAANCNTATEKSIFGALNESQELEICDLQDESCQEAVKKMVERLLQSDPTDYLRKTKLLGLINGSEPSNIVRDNYRAPFTC